MARITGWTVAVRDWALAVRDWLGGWLSEHRWLAAFVLLVAVLFLTAIALVWRDILEWGFADKTIWDMLEVLGVPLTVALIAAVVVLGSDRAAQRADLEQELQNQRLQEATLQAYLQRMTDLLVVHNLRGGLADSPVRAAAHAQTHAALRTLDGPRTGLIVRFLHDAGLIQRADPIISLDLADLADANLSSADLKDADLRGANLRDADLWDADLRGADLLGAVVSQEQLDKALDLEGARLPEVRVAR